MTSWVNLPFSSPISRHVAALCNEAADSTYISDFDINILASKPGKNFGICNCALFSHFCFQKPEKDIFFEKRYFD